MPLPVHRNERRQGSAPAAPSTSAEGSVIHTISVWLLAAGFLVAGLINVAGTLATRDEFVAWGYPAWWCWVIGGLEILTAALIAVPRVRRAGIVLGALIILAAVATLLRHRAYTKLPPGVAFLVVSALVVLTS
ncbi:MAG TPA: DoxX family protein [Xanthobacteraceae bacterium]|jgi:uncharacterized membrane protein YphA (DoxX/SURF4 family)